MENLICRTELEFFFYKLLKKDSLDFVFRDVSDSTWEQVYDNLSFQSFEYSSANVGYQRCYQLSNAIRYHDLSVVFKWNNQFIALWPLNISLNASGYSIGSNGASMIPPIFIRNTHKTTIAKINTLCFGLIQELCNYLQIPSWKSVERYLIEPSLSDWHMLFSTAGSIPKIRYDAYIDLEQDLSTIKNGFRKSYKSLVTSGLKLWNVLVMENPDAKLWSAFRELHLRSAGRVTRSIETWNYQLDLIERQKSFLVYSLNSDGEMVGGGLFSFSRDEADYSVGAYNRNLFDKSIAHVIQYRAVQELKRRNIKWYKVGIRRISNIENYYSEKELSTSHFFTGFGTHTIPSYCFYMKTV